MVSTLSKRGDIVRKKGFTLIELIVSMAILSIMLLTVSSLMLSTTKVYSNTSANAFLQQNTLVLQTGITNSLKFGTNVNVLEEKPTTFDETLNYIYVENNEIVLKAPSVAPKRFFTTTNVEQAIEFENIDGYNISVKLTLTNKNLSYENKFNVALTNVKEDALVQGTTGKCISFDTEKVLVPIVPPEITSFRFLVENNTLLSQEYSSNDAGASGINIDNTNNIIKVNTSVPIINTTQSASFVPTITYKGDGIKVKVGGVVSDYDVSSNTAIDFYNNDVYFIVNNYNGDIKEYKVDIDTDVFPMVENTKIKAVGTNGTQTSNDVLTPSKNDTLVAEFDFAFEPDGYQVRWYAVDPSTVSGLSELKSKYENGEYTPVAVTKNKNFIDITPYSSQLNNQKVFYDVVPVIEVNKNGEATSSFAN